jgi:hypothetical protein
LKKKGAIRGSPKIRAIDASTNGTIQMFGVMKRIESAAAVPKSVTNVADIKRLPTSARLRPVSTRTA